MKEVAWVDSYMRWRSRLAAKQADTKRRAEERRRTAEARRSGSPKREPRWKRPDLPGWVSERVRFVDRCAIWRGPLSTDGYAILTAGVPKTRAHRSLWIELHGPIPDGLVVMHLCDRRSCLNPDHLVLGTQRANLYDRDRKGRAVVPVRRNGQWTGEHSKVR